VFARTKPSRYFVIKTIADLALKIDIISILYNVMTNALAYYKSAISVGVKRFAVLAPRAHCLISLSLLFEGKNLKFNGIRFICDDFFTTS